MAHSNNYLADIERLVRVESPSDDRSALDQVLREANNICFEVLGSAGEISEVNGSPIFWWGPKSAEILLLIHLDTVWPKGSFLPLWKVEGDRITAPGSFDMKAGFVQAVYALQGISGSVALLCTTDEEVGSKASRVLIEESAKRARAVLVLEASINGAVKTGRKGTADFVIEVYGRAAHAGLEPEKGINSTTEIAHIIVQLETLANAEHQTTAVPTLLNSGTTTNTVPALARLVVDCRSFALSELERIEKALHQLKPQHPDARIEISGGINRPPLQPDATKSLFERAKKVHAALGRGELLGVAVGGASDGNFAAATGVPTLDGLGAIGGNAHAAGEWISAKGVASQIEFLHAFIKDLVDNPNG
jgi:glutamate carboxypeptidase